MRRPSLTMSLVLLTLLGVVIKIGNSYLRPSDSFQAVLDAPAPKDRERLIEFAKEVSGKLTTLQLVVAVNPFSVKQFDIELLIAEMNDPELIKEIIAQLRNGKASEGMTTVIQDLESRLLEIRIGQTY